MLDKWPPVRDITLKPIMHEKSKHIEIYWHFISDKIHLDDIVTTFVNSNDQLVDILIIMKAGKGAVKQYCWKHKMKCNRSHIQK